MFSKNRSPIKTALQEKPSPFIGFIISLALGGTLILCLSAVAFFAKPLSGAAAKAGNQAKYPKVAAIPGTVAANIPAAPASNISSSGWPPIAD